MDLFCFVLFCFVLFCFVLFCFVLFCFLLFAFWSDGLFFLISVLTNLMVVTPALWCPSNRLLNSQRKKKKRELTKPNKNTYNTGQRSQSGARLFKGNRDANQKEVTTQQEKKKKKKKKTTFKKQKAKSKKQKAKQNKTTHLTSILTNVNPSDLHPH